MKTIANDLSAGVFGMKKWARDQFEGIEEISRRSRKIPVRLSKRPPTDAEFRKETSARIRILEDEIQRAVKEIKKLRKSLLNSRRRSQR